MLVRLFVFLCVFLFPAVVFADGANPALVRLFDMVLEILAPIAALLGSWLLWKATRWFEKKTKLDIPDALEAKMDKWLVEGIAYAEEAAHKQLKSSKSKKKLTMGEKKEAALGYVLDQIDNFNGPKIASEKIEKMLEAKLAMTRE